MTAQLLRRDPSCRQAVELVTDYLEGALAPSKRQRFEAHLAACEGCDEYLRQVRLTVELLGRVEPEQLSPATRTGLVDLYRSYQASGNAEP